jgi:hypothetical protein
MSIGGGAMGAAIGTMLGGPLGGIVGGMIGSVAGDSIGGSIGGIIANNNTQDTQIHNTLMGLGNKNSPYGSFGYSVGDSRSVGRGIRKMAAEDPYFSSDQITQILEHGVQTGQFGGSSDVGDIKAKLRGMKEQAKALVEIFGGSDISEIFSTLRRMNSSGMTNMHAKEAMVEIGAAARSSGMSTMEYYNKTSGKGQMEAQSPYLGDADTRTMMNAALDVAWSANPEIRKKWGVRENWQKQEKKAEQEIAKLYADPKLARMSRAILHTGSPEEMEILSHAYAKKFAQEKFSKPYEKLTHKQKAEVSDMGLDAVMEKMKDPNFSTQELTKELNPYLSRDERTAIIRGDTKKLADISEAFRGDMSAFKKGQLRVQTNALIANRFISSPGARTIQQVTGVHIGEQQAELLGDYASYAYGKDAQALRAQDKIKNSESMLGKTATVSARMHQAMEKVGSWMDTLVKPFQEKETIGTKGSSLPQKTINSFMKHLTTDLPAEDVRKVMYETSQEQLRNFRADNLTSEPLLPPPDLKTTRGKTRVSVETAFKMSHPALTIGGWLGKMAKSAWRRTTGTSTELSMQALADNSGVNGVSDSMDPAEIFKIAKSGKVSEDTFKNVIAEDAEIMDHGFKSGDIPISLEAMRTRRLVENAMVHKQFMNLESTLLLSKKGKGRASDKYLKESPMIFQKGLLDTYSTTKFDHKDGGVNPAVYDMVDASQQLFNQSSRTRGTLEYVYGKSGEINFPMLKAAQNKLGIRGGTSKFLELTGIVAGASDEQKELTYQTLVQSGGTIEGWQKALKHKMVGARSLERAGTNMTSMMRSIGFDLTEGLNVKEIEELAKTFMDNPEKYKDDKKEKWMGYRHRGVSDILMARFGMSEEEAFKTSRNIGKFMITNKDELAIQGQAKKGMLDMLTLKDGDVKQSPLQKQIFESADAANAVLDYYQLNEEDQKNVFESAKQLAQMRRTVDSPTAKSVQTKAWYAASNNFSEDAHGEKMRKIAMAMGTSMDAIADSDKNILEAGSKKTALYGAELASSLDNLRKVSGMSLSTRGEQERMLGFASLFHTEGKDKGKMMSNVELERKYKDAISTPEKSRTLQQMFLVEAGERAKALGVEDDKITGAVLRKQSASVAGLTGIDVDKFGKHMVNGTTSDRQVSLLERIDGKLQTLISISEKRQGGEDKETLSKNKDDNGAGNSAVDNNAKVKNVSNVGAVRTLKDNISKKWNDTDAPYMPLTTHKALHPNAKELNIGIKKEKGVVVTREQRTKNIATGESEPLGAIAGRNAHEEAKNSVIKVHDKKDTAAHEKMKAEVEKAKKAVDDVNGVYRDEKGHIAMAITDEKIKDTDSGPTGKLSFNNGHMVLNFGESDENTRKPKKDKLGWTISEDPVKDKKSSVGSHNFSDGHMKMEITDGEKHISDEGKHNTSSKVGTQLDGHKQLTAGEKKAITDVKVDDKATALEKKPIIGRIGADGNFESAPLDVKKKTEILPQMDSSKSKAGSVDDGIKKEVTPPMESHGFSKKVNDDKNATVATGDKISDISRKTDTKKAGPDMLSQNLTDGIEKGSGAEKAIANAMMNSGSSSAIASIGGDAKVIDKASDSLLTASAAPQGQTGASGGDWGEKLERIVSAINQLSGRAGLGTQDKFT